MKTQTASVVAVATLGLAAILSTIIQPAQAATISWGSSGAIAGTANSSPTATLFAATNWLSVSISSDCGMPIAGIAPTAEGTSRTTDSVMATRATSGEPHPAWQSSDRSEHQGLLGPLGCWQGLSGPVHMSLGGFELMSLDDSSSQGLGVQGWDFDSRTGSEWQEVSVGADASLSLALNRTQSPGSQGR